MPRMLPSDIYDGCPSPGEREIFASLKNDEKINSWTVLHSLDLANHARQVSGEADFVIIVPTLGVLCLEVKACQSVRREDQGWFYGRSPVPHHKGPFRQASEAMHSIRERVITARPSLSGVLFWSAVIFPYLEFNIRSTEWHDWQIIDSRKMQSRGLTSSIAHVLNCAREYVASKLPGLSKTLCEPRPSLTETDDIAALLRPNFEVAISPRNRSKKITEELIAFTTEQYAALDALENNDRILFRGPAGTGKTFLAMEAAKRASKSGRKVALICFNRLLREWIFIQIKEWSATITVQTLHSYALGLANAVPTPAQATSTNFWRNELPALALESVLNDNSKSNLLFDELIVDEAQDVLSPQYLDVLEFSVTKGLRNGRWRFFGDFENQAIFNTQEGVQPVSVLRSYAPSLVEFSLRNNCRNPPRIACLVHLLGRLNPDYTRVLRPDNGAEPEIIFFRDAGHQIELLVEKLEAFQLEGFDSSDIVILSARSDQSSVAVAVNDPRWKQRLKPLALRKKGDIGYCSIHAFKGLEASVIIVVDLARLDPVSTADLFYVGVTRAVERLVVLMKEDTRQDVIRSLRKEGRQR
jgi:hypothetical protein